MALRYGSKNGSALRYNPYSASALRYGSKTAWSSGGDSDIGFDISTPTDNSYFTFTLLDDDTYSIAAADITNMPEDLVIPDTYEGKAVTVIPASAFAITNMGTDSISLLKNIYIPASITSIGNQAFQAQLNLSSVIVANNSNLTSIGEQVFYFSGINLTAGVGTLSVNLEGATKLTTMGAKWFVNSGLTKIIFPRNVRSIGDYAFAYCSNLITVVIPNSVTSIGASAFIGCGNLASITIPNSVTYIGDSAFGSCTKLTNITIPDSVTSIGDFAFSGCSSLTDIVIPDSFTSIGKGWFVGCDNLTRVVIPDRVTSIGERAFENCGNLTTVVIPDSVTSIGEEAFRDCSDNLTIYCEAESQPEGWDLSWNFEHYPVVWGYNPLGDDYLTFTEQADGTYSVKATDVSNLPSEIVLPCAYNGKAVTAIDANAFRAATMTKVVIPAGIITIGEKAFDECRDITDISIPSSVNTIGSQAFGSCTSLTELVLPSGITEIPSYCFFNCAALTGFTIPDTVTSIGQLAFAHCKFTSIVIPASVTTIGSKVFFNCANLTINCEAASQPEGWDANWNVKDYNSNTHTANWGYTS